MKRDMEQGAGVESGLSMKEKKPEAMVEQNKKLAGTKGVGNWGNAKKATVGDGFKAR